MTNQWRQKSCQQPIDYPDQDALNHVLSKLRKLPPLVTPLEIDRLKKEMARAANGEVFILQGGDCAENFNNCTPKAIINKLKILLQMSLILIHGLRKPVLRIGRIAGQYAKPRTELTETKNGVTLPSYRGDLINQLEFERDARIPNPKLMLTGYDLSGLTLNYIRALVDGGFADLQHPEYWNLDFVQHSPLADEYQALVHSIGDAITFVKTISGLPNNANRIDFYTSHEALNLYYEEALTHSYNHFHYDLSTHLPWIGMRTSDPEGAHVEFFSGIHNPIALKIGPTMSLDCLHQLLIRLNPSNEVGKIMLIMRLGTQNVTTKLPIFIDAIQKAGQSVVWSCDPMHGNTKTTAQGYKTRRFDDILNELRESFRIHKEMGSYFGGVHFELTGENVTECIGGARGLSEADLHQAYESLVDPRLNYEQALEMAMLIVKNAA
jgi:3-deoxy-7-phosphoheptulonate synthase